MKVRISKPVKTNFAKAYASLTYNLHKEKIFKGSFEKSFFRGKKK